MIEGVVGGDAGGEDADAAALQRLELALVDGGPEAEARRVVRHLTPTSVPRLWTGQEEGADLGGGEDVRLELDGSEEAAESDQLLHLLGPTCEIQAHGG